MMHYGTEIINKKTKTVHKVDDIEVINNETLVFTQDLKCFPISEIQTCNIQNSELHNHNSKIIELTNSLIQVLDYNLPYAEKKPSFIEKVISKFFGLIVLKNLTSYSFK